MKIEPTLFHKLELTNGIYMIPRECKKTFKDQGTFEFDELEKVFDFAFKMI